MSRWVDTLTGVTYEIDEQAQASLAAHLAEELACLLEARHLDASKPSFKQAADDVAEFWATYYPQLVYPVRLERQELGAAAPASTPSPDVRPVKRLSGPWRSAYLGDGQPPLLPAASLRVDAPDTLLGAEWALSASLFAMAALAALAEKPQRQGHESPKAKLDPEELGAIRLGLLLYPLWRAIRGRNDILGALAARPQVAAVAACLEGDREALPGPAQEVVSALRGPAESQAVRGDACVLVAQAVRIKQYVFESPSLPQIRGGSLLIERAVQKAAELVAGEFGPECVLRCVGGTLVAVLPGVNESEAANWRQRVLSAAYRVTGTARFAAGTSSVAIDALHPATRSEEFGESQQQAYARLNRVRENAAEPIWETLPFEARCDACGERAAEWQKEVAGETRWLCSVCYQRDEVGRSERYRLLEQVWDDVGVNPAALIRPPEDQENWTGPVPPSLNELVPEKDRRRRWIAMVYGDGNNFGGIVQRLRGVADQLHWSRRLYWTVRGLTELALAEAIRFFAADGSTPAASRKVRFAYYPFEILTIGGDDVAFFAWAPVALKAVERLQAFLTREFAQAAGTGPDAWPPVTFSFGIAIADSHTPARRLQEVAEDVLLKRVKAETPHGSAQGLTGFLVATSPADMNPERAAQLWRQKAPGNGTGVELSVQPVTAEQLAFLLDLALELAPEVGRLSRITAPFLATTPDVASLYYRYLRARAKGRSNEAGERAADSFFDILEARRTVGKGWDLFTVGAQEPERVFPLLPRRAEPLDRGRGAAPIRVVPLVDLLQIVKAFQ